MYQDRTDAGRRLARRLVAYRSASPFVVALPRGGVPVAAEIALALRAPLDLAFVRKLGYPGQPELAIGAIADGDRDEVLLNNDIEQDDGVPPDYIESETRRKSAELHAMEAAFADLRPTAPRRGRTLIAVDDGVATGATMRVVLRRLRRDDPKALIVAVPVGSSEAIELLAGEADDVVCLDIPSSFMAVGEFYRDFSPVTDEEVRSALIRCRSELLSDSGRGR